MNLLSFSQTDSIKYPKIIKYNNDTVIVYTINQSKNISNLFITNDFLTSKNLMLENKIKYLNQNRLVIFFIILSFKCVICNK